MKTLLFLTLVFCISTAEIHAQAKAKTIPKPTPKPKVAKPATTVDKGVVSGRTYTNKMFGFEITFPDTWLIPDDDFEAYMKKQGFDLGLKAPDSLPPASKAKVDKALKSVQILLTAYRSMPGSKENAIVRISVENLAANPQIKDAVDYFDAVRAMYATMKLPADFRYSETQAEELGAMQFGFLGATSSAGNKRIYATVRKGYAILFTLSYSDNADLATFRDILAQGNFAK
jgi:hypothetical protein